ncbi:MULTISPECIES: EF-hand domain-containing protein [unclassified Sphingomonas]|uniref:EF-hand domain-containing protein n=1 Tax=unclassified Sphingomonas TaxID=196159 RepID=UPI001F59EFD7|nr:MULTISPECIES: EF-hand domain-containing protein [unclassified Sphingomonas]
MRLVPALLAAAALASPALAVETRASAAAKFKAEFAATDTNHDGSLSRAEVQARTAQMKTGQANVDPTHAKRLADLWFDNADANKDGKVTLAEAQALFAKMMDKYDRNRNGQISANEGAAAKADLARGPR